MTLLQIPTEMLNEDTTFKVFLFFVIVVLILAIGFLWRAKEKRDEYIREQDKANLTMLNEVTNAVKDVATNTNENKENISTLKLQSQRLLDIIQERLKHGSSK
mgnify:CR=1 FL=1